MILNTLTDFESAGFHSLYCLADGHAYQDLHESFETIIQSLPKIWYESSKKTVYDAEKDFCTSFSSLIKSSALKNFENYRICPTASNSIDLIAAVLKTLNLDTVLIEPSFDNLALLLKRRGVKLDALCDNELFQAAESDEIATIFPDLKNVGALFIVNPNNPTGVSLSESGFKNLVGFCEKNKIILVIDNSFRVYRKNFYDDYHILINSSVQFISFEDTGKVWPTQDLKASIVYFSEKLKNIFQEIYYEVYLCVSNFSLGVISAFFDETNKVGINETILDLVKKRRTILRKAIQNSMLSIPEISYTSNLPVEWIFCETPHKNDFVICNELREIGVAVLPGRQFYWNSHHDANHQKFIRISLMKRNTTILHGIDILQKYCNQSILKPYKIMA